MLIYIYIYIYAKQKLLNTFYFIVISKTHTSLYINNTRSNLKTNSNEIKSFKNVLIIVDETSMTHQQR